MKGDSERKASDRKYRPTEGGRAVSRYGFIEKALRKIKEQHGSSYKFSTNEIVTIARRLDPNTVRSILVFTSGVKRTGKNEYEFTHDEIRVQGDF